MARYIKAFTKFPKELFRVNNGPKIRLRVYDSSAIAQRSYDVVAEAGAVKPKALSPETYEGKISSPRYSSENC